MTDQGQQTFQTWDTIDGGAGVNTLNVQNTGANVISATLANIQNLSVQDTTATGAQVTLNLKGLSTLTNVDLDGNASGSGYVINNLGSLPSITLTGTGTTSTFNFTAAALQPAGQTLDLTLSGVTGTAQVGSAGPSTLVLSDTGSNALETVSITSTGSANTLGGLTTSGLGVTTLNISGDQQLTLGAITDTNSTLKTINASASTGGVSLTSLAGSTVSGGDGNDTLTSGGGIDSMTGGAGSDRFVFGTNLDNFDTITGGTGTDALWTTATTANNYARVSPQTISGVETLSITDAGAALALVTADISADITTVELQAGTASAASTLTMLAGTANVNVGRSADTTVQVLLGDLTINDTGSATTDVLNLSNTSFDTSVTSAGDPTSLDAFNGKTVTVGGYETVNLSTGTSTGVANTINAITLTGDAGAATTLKISGANSLTTAATTGIITAGTIDASGLTGNAALTMRVAAASVTAITGSANADVLRGDTSTSIAGGAGNDSIFGGSSADTLLGQDGNDTIVGAGGNDSIDGGAGNDTVVEVAANITVNDTIKGGDGAADVLQIGTFTTAAGLNATALSGISQFEILEITAAGDATLLMSDFENNTGFTEIRANPSTSTLTLNNVGSTTNTLALTGGTGTVVFDRLIDASTNALTVNTRTGSTATAITLTALTANDEETISFNTTQTNDNGTTAAHNTTITTLNASDLTTLNVSGAGSFTIDNGIVGATALATVNASSSTGAIDIDANTSLANMTVTAGIGALTFIAGGGNDSVTGSDVNDNLTGNAGADTLVGNAGNDVLVGGTGADSISGGAGTDTYSAVGTNVAGADGGSAASVGQVINLGATGLTAAQVNSDIGTAAQLGISSGLSGVSSNQAVYLGATVSGAATAVGLATTIDSLSSIENVIGSTGTDYIIGSAGNNVITGGNSADVMTGGAGADRFAYASTTASTTAGLFSEAGSAVGAAATTAPSTSVADNITDFVSGTDKIQLTVAFGTAGAVGGLIATGGSSYTTASSGLAAADFVAVVIGGNMTAVTANTPGAGRFLYDDTNDILYYDISGDSVISSTGSYTAGANDDFVVAKGISGLQATDFVFA